MASSVQSTTGINMVQLCSIYMYSSFFYETVNITTLLLCTDIGNLMNEIGNSIAGF